MSNDVFKRIARSTAKGGLILFIGTFLSKIILSVSSILIGRLLGPEAYGVFNLSLTPGRFLFIFTGLGITISLVRYLSLYQEKQRHRDIMRILKTAFTFQVIISLVLSIILYLFAKEFSIWLINRPDAATYVRLTSIWLFWFVIYSTLNNVFYGLGMMKQASIHVTLQSILRLAVAPTLIVLGYGVMGAIAGHITSFLFSSIVGIGFVVFYIKKRTVPEEVGEIPVFEFDLLRDMLILGFPAYFPTLVSNFMWVYRNYIMSMFTTDYDIGNFLAAFYIFTVFTILLEPIHNTLFSSFSRIDLDVDRETAVKLLRYSVKYSVLAIIPLTFFAMFFSREVMVVVFGWKYKNAYPYLILLLINYLYMGIGRVTLPSFYKGIGETRILFKAGLINLGISVPLYYLLMPYLSIFGIILTMIISGLASILYQFIHASRLFPGAFNFREIFSIYTASFITGLILWLLRQYFYIKHTWGNLFFYFLLFIILFLVILPLSRGITRTDIHNFEAAYRDFPAINKIVYLLARFEEWIMDIFKLE